MSGPLLYPKAVWRPVPSHGGPMSEQRGLVEHITTNDFSPYNFFSNPNNQASSTWWIAADGTVEQYIDARMRAWAEAAGNGTWCSAEISGQPGTLKTPEQCEAFADLIAWGHNHPELQWQIGPSDSPDVHGIGWHGMGGQAWGGHVYCPGQQRVDQTRQIVLPRARQLAGITSQEPDMPLTDADVAKVAAASRAAVQQDLRVLLHGLKDGNGNETHPANLDALWTDVEKIKQHLGIA